MIRLLSKSEIDKAKSLDRQREVTEGVKLAKRVDSLREIQAQEEASLQKFRSETVAVIYKEISKAVAERDSLLRDIAKMTEENKPIYAQIDIEWKKIASKNEQIETLSRDLFQKNIELETRENNISLIEKSLKDEESRIRDERARSSTNLRVTDNLVSQAREKLEESELKKKSVDEYTAYHEKAFARKDKELEEKEKNIQLKIELIAKEELRLVNEAKRIKDRYETLLRTEKRLNKKI